jgi:excisionase family DNA binding protein
MTTAKPKWVSVAYVADRTGFSRWTLYEMAREGRIPAHRIGRSVKFVENEIDDWMAKAPRASA